MQSVRDLKHVDIGHLDGEAYEIRVPGPGRFLATHPWLYRMSICAATATATYAFVRSVRDSGRRLPWIVLAVLEAGIVAGMLAQRARARTVAPMDAPRTR